MANKNHQIHIQTYTSAMGELVLGSFAGCVCLLDFANSPTSTRIKKRLQQKLQAEFMVQDDAVLIETRRQVADYLAGQRTDFNLPLLMVGTAFQQTVWRALRQQAYGTTLSYLALAKLIQHETAVRAVANANAANAIALVIPCHRVIANNGGLGGYSGGLAIKAQLLQLEYHYFNQ